MLAGLDYQDAIERRCFEVAGDYRAPAQRVPDFFAGRTTEDLPRTTYPMGVVPGDLASLLPEPVVAGMRHALRAFGRRLPGFDGPEAILIGPETRTTCPVRFDRSADGESVGIGGLYLVGEGAGYAGGIVSAALDGLRAARRSQPAP